MSGHTPGPFLVESGLGAACVYAVEEHRGKQRNRMFAQVQGGPDTPRDEIIANARLFAAAPGLLEALKELAWTGDDQKKCWDDCRKSGQYERGAHSAQCMAARAAIAKAEGK